MLRRVLIAAGGGRASGCLQSGTGQPSDCGHMTLISTFYKSPNYVLDVSHVRFSAERLAQCFAVLISMATACSVRDELERSVVDTLCERRRYDSS